MPMKQSAAESATQLVPRWRVGDRWVVRYRGKVDLGEARRDAKPAVWEYEWHYRVASIDDTGIRVIADVRFPFVEENAATATYARDGRVLAIEEASITGGEVSGPLYFPLSPGRYSPVAFEWPAFPLTENREAPLPDGIQEDVQHTGNTWRVTMRRRGDLPLDPGWKRENTMEQLWEVDRPWWTSIVIRYRVEGPDDVTEDVDVEGRVTEWHLVE